MYRSSVCNGLGYNQWGEPLLYLWGRFTLSQSIKRENYEDDLVGRLSVKQATTNGDVTSTNTEHQIRKGLKGQKCLQTCPPPPSPVRDQEVTTPPPWNTD
ncbi:hypothetical protein CEXT_187231 [Caerostris extrusa]|uniref:Uncharacterized protein n=1 Tax=Caerostris extrusa TaxID=172846 RepID=A0AAV4VTP1_CAEEX|nr:hypothetical protein CEXT_187231 [Caerostris extrusa]